MGSLGFYCISVRLKAVRPVNALSQACWHLPRASRLFGIAVFRKQLVHTRDRLVFEATSRNRIIDEPMIYLVQEHTIFVLCSWLSFGDEFVVCSELVQLRS